MIQEVLSGWFLSKFYLSYYKFLFFTGIFYSLVPLPESGYETVAYTYTFGRIFFIFFRSSNQIGSGKKKRKKTNVPHRIENLLGFLFLVFSLKPLLS